jgi:hypothetical protein
VALLHAIEPHAIAVLPCAANQKSPGSLRGFEARCLLEAAPAPPLPGQLVRCAVWSAWLNMAFSDAAISVGELAV